ncbi:MAG: hypothetical protein WB559_16340 [Candidatus Acidiferrales bacterium]
MAQKIKKVNKEVKKLVVGFTGVLLGKYAELRFSPAELRSFLDASLDLWYLDPKHFLEKLDQLFDELEEQRKSPFKIGRHIAEYLEN